MRYQPATTTWVLPRRVAVIAIAIATISSSFVPTTSKAADSWCPAAAGNQWDSQRAVCSATTASKLGATMNISISVPGQLMSDPTAGPVLEAFARHLLNGWRTTGETVPRDTNAGTDYLIYSTSGSVTSVVFHEFIQTVGSNANNAYRTFTFDVAQGKQLQLGDLFMAGVDPITALPPLVRPYLIPALADAAPSHQPDTYPFVPEKWEPQSDGSGFSGNYKAFALTSEELILYMPGEPMTHENPIPRGQIVWSMDGGTVIVHVPRNAITSILRPL